MVTCVAGEIIKRATSVFTCDELFARARSYFNQFTAWPHTYSWAVERANRASIMPQTTTRGPDSTINPSKHEH